MPDAILGKGAYRRDNGNLPELKLINMFPEASPVSDEGVALLSFPGVESAATRGAGPINGIFQKAGLFSGDVFTVSNNTLYRGATSLGAITGSGPVSWAASDTEIVLTRGGTAYSYNGTNLAAIAFPDSADVTAVAGVIGGLFLYARADSARWYWSAVLDGRTIDALDYATAESAPDKLRDIVAIGDNVYLMGEDTIEVWYITGDLNLPFSRISQRTVRIGVIATGCALEMDNALHFIGSNRIAYRMSEVPERISDHSMEERIGQSSSWACFTFTYQGHVFFVIRLSQGTWLADAATAYKHWCEKQTWGLSNWIAKCAVTLETGPQFGSATTNDIFEFEGWAEGSSPLLRQFPAFFPIKGGCVPVDHLELECNAGATTVTSGADASPVIEMRSSRDGGDTFTNWRMAPLGAMGQYRKRPRWRRLGYFDAPGALIEFRCTAASPLRISAVRVNESAAGRSR